MDRLNPIELDIVIDGDGTADERRAHQRHVSSSYLRALELPSGEVLGDLEDIGLGGLRLRARRPVNPGHVQSLRLEACFGGQQIAAIELHAECVWVRIDPRCAEPQAGFQFVEPTDLVVAELQELIDALSA